MEWNTRYIGSLLYLVIPGSVIGFTAYLTLVGRMGPERAAYCTVLFPLVALNVSAFYEGYQWTAPALFGLVLVMLGNVLVFRKPKATVGAAAVVGADLSAKGRNAAPGAGPAAQSIADESAPTTTRFTSRLAD
jgi:drug/metabolite transporter (DMT)-like permease